MSSFPSDFGQDRWVIEHVFKARLSEGYRGFFIEAGASEGLAASNTYALQHEHRWSGLLVEPNPSFFARLADNRRGAICVQAALAEQDRKVQFVAAGYYGAVVEHLRPLFGRWGLDMRKHSNYLCDADGSPAQWVSVQARSLESLLHEVDAPTTIDYMSLDLEGSEFEALKGFPFDTHKIGALTLEATYPSCGVLIDHEHREPCRQLLESHGYYRVGTIGVDDAYLPITPQPND